MTAVIAIVLASISLLFNLFQWLSRHRPYIGIVDMRLGVFNEDTADDIRCPDSVKIKIKNVGEAPAKDIRISGEIKSSGFTAESKIYEFKPRELGILFPGQEVQFYLGLGGLSSKLVDEFLQGYGTVTLNSRIDYKSVLFLRFHLIHRTWQEHFVFQEPETWSTRGGGEYN